jgi:hypothetical protein
MSRSIGLREDQREGEVLATLIAVLFPVDAVWCHREQARSHKESAADAKFADTADQLWERACSRRGRNNQ